MKQIKLISAILLIATVISGLNACSEDDNGNAPTGSVIKKIEVGNYFAADINYTDSRATGCKIYSPYFPLVHADVSVLYQGDKIIVTSNGKDDGDDGLDGWLDGNWSFTYTLENGLAKSCVAKTPENSTVTSSFSYNSDGYLTKIIVVGESEFIDFVYNNGNLIKYDYTEGNRKTTYTVSTSNIENKSNFPMELYAIATELAGGGNLLFNSLYVSYLGIFGKTSAFLPEKINTLDFVYQTDGNGNITSVKTNEKWYNNEAMIFSFSY